MGHEDSKKEKECPQTPKLAVLLTSARIRKAAPRTKPYKLSDGLGLYLEIMPNGSRFWRMRYRQASGKPSSVSFGRYPDVSLAAAREARDRAHKLLAEGKNPVEVNREQVRQTRAAQPPKANFRLSVNAQGELTIDKTRNRISLNAA